MLKIRLLLILAPLLLVESRHDSTYRVPISRTLTKTARATPNPTEVIQVQTSVTPEADQLQDYVCQDKNRYEEILNKKEAYIECRGNDAFLKTCPEGLQFNSAVSYPDNPCIYHLEDKSLMVINESQTPSIDRPVRSFRSRSKSSHNYHTISQLYRHSCKDVDGYEPVPNKCNAFVECKSNNAFLNVCPRGLHFNPDVPHPECPCSHPTELRHRCPIFIEEREIVPDTTSSSTTTTSTTTTTTTTTTPKPTTTTTTATTTPEPPTRPPMKIVTRLRPVHNHLQNYVCKVVDGYEPVEDQCESYILCRRKKAYFNTCSKGLNFNPEAQYPEYPCTHPSNLKKFIVLDTPQIQPTEAPFEINLLNDYGCRANDGYEAIEDQSDAYIICRRNKAYLNRCPDGLHFNPKSQCPDYPCMHPRLISSSSSTTSTTTTTTTSTTTTSTTTPKPELKMTIPYEINRLNDYVCRKENGYEPVTNKCDAYIVCRIHKAFVNTCPHGLQFDSEVEYPGYPCTRPLEVSSESPIINIIEEQPSLSTTPVSTTPELRTSPTEVSYETNRLNDYICKELNGYEAVSDKCDSYIECRDNIAFLYECPEGLQFDLTAQYPEDPCTNTEEFKSYTDIEEPQGTEQCPYPERSLYYMPGDDCEQYTICQNGLDTTMTCPSGLAFNSETSRCDWAADIPGCGGDEDVEFTCPTPRIDRYGNHIITKHRHKSSCKGYIACHKGRPRFRSCNAGKYFDSISESCVHPEVSDCQQDLEELY